MVRNNGETSEPLRSTYADDDAIADILPVFINNMPRYLNDLDDRIRRSDWPAAARVCHDLKGTAGGYGYPQIGRAVQLLEAEVKGAHRPAELEFLLHEVVTLCERARLGLGSVAEPLSH